MKSQGRPGNQVLHLECTRPSHGSRKPENQVGGHIADMSSVPHISEWESIRSKGIPEDEEITHADIERAVNELRRLRGLRSISWPK